MKKFLGIWLVLFLIACNEQPRPTADAQGIVDLAIEASGGDRY
jgi:hypothetical protein